MVMKEQARRKHVESDFKNEYSFSGNHCPVKEQADLTLKSSRETHQAIHKLREYMLNCGVCPHFHQCELQEDIALQIDLVIAEINEEWGW